MKKKLLSFIFALCLIIPCGIMLTACGKDPKDPDEPSPENAVAVTIDFSMRDDITFSDLWDIDEQTNTYTITYGDDSWSDELFEVVATTEDGNTRTLQQATEQNPAGYKIATNIPDKSTWTSSYIPAGTYTFKLYCDAFNNGIYKTEACEGETYTIIVNKKVLDHSSYGSFWNRDDFNPTEAVDEYKYTGSEVNIYFETYFSELEGIYNFEKVTTADSVWSATEVGDYTAKIKYDIDENNYIYNFELPDEEFEWSIVKVDLSNTLANIWTTYDADESFYEKTYTGSPIELISSLEMLTQHLQGHNNLTLTGVKVNGVEASFPIMVTDIGEYVITPIVTQSDTQNYVDINADPDFDEKYSRTITVTKQKLLASDFYWEGATSVTYNPDETHIITLNVPQGVTVSYVTEGSTDSRQNTNSAKNAGLYLAKATISYDTNLYKIVGTPVLECEWEITKRAITLEGAYWYFGGLSTTNPVVTYENSHLVRPTLYGAWGYDITTTYYDSNEQVISESGTLELGTYKAVVEIDYDTNNYYMAYSDFEFEWTVVKGNYQDYYSHWSGLKTIHSDSPESEYVLSENTNSITLTKEENTSYDFCFEPYFTPNSSFVIKYYVNEIPTETNADGRLSFSEIGTYVVTIDIEGQDSTHYNEIDTSAYTLTINIVEAE